VENGFIAIGARTVAHYTSASAPDGERWDFWTWDKKNIFNIGIPGDQFRAVVRHAEGRITDNKDAKWRPDEALFALGVASTMRVLFRNLTDTDIEINWWQEMGAATVEITLDLAQEMIAEADKAKPYVPWIRPAVGDNLPF